MKPGIGWGEEYEILLRARVGSTVQKRKIGNKLEEQNSADCLEEVDIESTLSGILLVGWYS